MSAEAPRFCHINLRCPSIVMKHNEDQIDAYIRGEMTPSEKSAFEDDMRQNSALTREVNVMRLIVGGLKDRQEKMETMAQWQQGSKEQAASRRIANHPWIPWITAFSVAAALILGAFLFYPVFLLPSPVPNNTILRTDMRGGDFSEIDSLIEQGHFQEALDAIQSEMVEADSLLHENVRKRDEADYEIKKYEYALKLLQQKQDEIEALRGSE